MLLHLRFGAPGELSEVLIFFLLLFELFKLHEEGLRFPPCLLYNAHRLRARLLDFPVAQLVNALELLFRPLPDCFRFASL